MAGTTVSKENSKELRKLFALLANATSETLGSLVGRELVVQPQEILLTDADELLGSIERAHALVRGALDKEYAGKTMLALFEVQDACAMAGLLMMTPDEVVEKNRQRGVLEGEDSEAFGELGNVLYSGLGNVLREAMSNVDIRLQDHGMIKPGLDADGYLPEEPLVAGRIKLKVGNFPETSAWFVLDQVTAEAWNKGPLAAPEAESGADGSEAKGADSLSRLIDDELEDIPAAPIVGVLNAYVAAPETMRVLRRSCRRVGLELRRHNRAQIPNPAAHPGEIVLMDVPNGEERRFDWCRRIKEYGAPTKVVLLLHRPSRSRVTQAFLSQADIILGFPLEEPQLSQKLSSLVEQTT